MRKRGGEELEERQTKQAEKKIVSIKPSTLCQNGMPSGEAGEDTDIGHVVSAVKSGEKERVWGVYGAGGAGRGREEEWVVDGVAKKWATRLVCCV